MQRLGDQIQRELAVLIRELKDPRLGMVTVSAVKVSKDMGYAEVYVTVLGKDLEVGVLWQVAAGLKAYIKLSRPKNMLKFKMKIKP